jgi:hypothetical protein
MNERWTNLGLQTPRLFPPLRLIFRNTRLLLLVPLLVPLELLREVGVVERIILGRVHVQLCDLLCCAELFLSLLGCFGCLLLGLGLGMGRE